MNRAGGATPASPAEKPQEPDQSGVVEVVRATIALIASEVEVQLAPLRKLVDRAGDKDQP